MPTVNFDFTGITSGQLLNVFEPQFVKLATASTNTVTGGSTAGTLSFVGNSGTPTTYAYETGYAAHSIKVTYASSDGSGSMLPCCARIVDYQNMIALRFLSATNLQLIILTNQTPVADTSWTVTRGANDTIELIVGHSDVIQVKHNGTLLTFPSSGTTSKTITNFSGATKVGFCARAQAAANVITAAELTGILPAQTVTSINGGSPIPAGELNVGAVTTGFTALPDTITTDASGLTCGNIGGTVNAPEFDISDRVDGGLYPKAGTTVEFTFDYNGTETASGVEEVTAKDDETIVIIASPLFTANTLANAILDQTGRTVGDNDEFYHTELVKAVPDGEPSDLVIGADTDWECTDAGSFDLWVWVSSGSDAGKMFYYAVTLTESGAVVITGTSKNHYIGFGLGIGF